MSRFISRFREQPRDIKWLLLGITGICSLGWLTNTQDPNYLFSLITFFLILSITVYSITLFTTNIVRHGLLVGSGVLVLFILRLLGLRDWYYIMLLAVCLISLELYFQKR
jgi:hypothetical protein